MIIDLNTEINVARCGLNRLFSTKGSIQKIGLGDLLVELNTASGSAITSLIGDVTTIGSGIVTATLANTGVVPGSYSAANITVDSKGRILSAASGAGGGGISGGGTANQVSIFNSSFSITSYPGFTSDSSGNVTVSTLTAGSLSGILRATSGLISGSATTDNLPQGGTNLYYTNAQVYSALSVDGGSDPLVYDGFGQFSMPQSSGSQNGYLSESDWATFNNKQSALTIGSLTETGTDGIAITNGTGSVIGSGTIIAQAAASGSQNGYLSSADWNTFNNTASNLSHYLPLAGGTMTGDINMSGATNINFGTGQISFDTNNDFIQSQPHGALYINGQYAVKLQQNGSTVVEVNHVQVIIPLVPLQLGTLSNYSLVASDGSKNLVSLSNGIAGQVLTSTGPSGPPQWQPNGVTSYGQMYYFNNSTPLSSTGSTSNVFYALASGASLGSAQNITLSGGPTSGLVLGNSGIYLINWSVGVTSASPQYVAAAVGVNGTAIMSTVCIGLTEGSRSVLAGTGILSLSAGQIIGISTENLSSSTAVQAYSLNLSVIQIG